VDLGVSVRFLKINEQQITSARGKFHIENTNIK
jgi:hypothetical protein